MTPGPERTPEPADPRARASPALRPAAFLDRDDTLIANRTVTAETRHPGDLFDPRLVQLLPGVAEGLRRLRAAGYLMVCVSNQGAVARGVCGIEDVIATNRRVQELVIARAGVQLDAVYFCPYHPRGTRAPWNTEHPWRKPAPGMLLQAADDLGIDLARSWMIGDAERDIQAALGAGIPLGQTVLLGDGPGRAGHRASTFEAALRPMGVP